MSDIVKRLHKRKAFFLNGAHWLMTNEPDQDCQEAADEIERLKAALREIENNACKIMGRKVDYCHPEGCLSPGIARAALEEKP